MHIATVGSYPITIGWLIALLVVILGILGLVGVVPFTATTGFGLLIALGVARLT